MDTMNQSYQKAIDILIANKYDAERVAIELAKVNPELFVTLIEKVQPASPVSSWQRDVVEMILTDAVVNGIKATRVNTNLGLKEAKDIIDNVRVKLHMLGYHKYDHISSVTPRDSMRAPELRVLEDFEYVVDQLRRNGELAKIVDRHKDR